MASHVALIRGINVGGKNPVSMARLREVLGERGTPSRTHIASGNVLLEAPDLDEAGVESLLEDVLREEFGVDTVVVGVAEARMRAAVDDAPAGFGAEPHLYHSDVAFLRAGVDAEEAFAAFGLREGVDTGWPGKGMVYFRRLSAQRTKSRMNKVMSTPFYADMTIRSWNTTVKLVDLLDGE
ncbi:DUF1697 domain-containing protein [Demequina silvatica]|uniref:DUF1697 domain-containing protein n=1 Tax=Demequina silvatica TaxID=1638988 RepID=UPI000782B01C|nr:DUF1697 domain-containing protein [Demequina silvatica]